MMPGETDAGSAGKQPAEGYTGLRCAQGASGSARKLSAGAVLLNDVATSPASATTSSTPETHHETLSSNTRRSDQGSPLRFRSHAVPRHASLAGLLPRDEKVSRPHPRVAQGLQSLRATRDGPGPGTHRETGARARTTADLSGRVACLEGGAGARHRPAGRRQ